jgi:16S rRNA (cytosine967-C5)-methyltransferase
VNAQTDPPSADDPLIARRAALDLLRAALSRRGGLDEALSAGRYLALSPLDRGFARAMVMAALRQLGPIDRALDGKLKREPPAPARDLLRLGLAQAFWLDTPAFAAVDTTVSLAPKPLRGLVNAVLRGAAAAGPGEPGAALASGPLARRPRRGRRPGHRRPDRPRARHRPDPSRSGG